jgi:hypothetical protein
VVTEKPESARMRVDTREFFIDTFSHAWIVQDDGVIAIPKEA